MNEFTFETRTMFGRSPPADPLPDDGKVVATHEEPNVGTLGIPARLHELDAPPSALPGLVQATARNTGASIRPASKAPLLALLEEVG